MKFFLIVFLGMFSTGFLFAQNVGIGTNNPMTKLEVQGSFRVQLPYTTTSTPPAVAQTKTMVNANTVSFTNSDSTGRIYDPGGPAGNYNANITANASINSSSSLYYLDFLIESINLGTGDSLTIYSGLSAASPVALAVGNGYTASNIALSLDNQGAFIIFKSNTDASTGTGFSILFKRRYPDNTVPDAVIAGGNQLVFYPAKGALRSGAVGNSAIGLYSTSLSSRSVASGKYSFALGYDANAAGESSSAIGSSSEAIGDYSTAIGYGAQAKSMDAIAMGFSTVASGVNSLATGNNTQASGIVATTFGDYTRADGWGSVAMGYHTIAKSNYSLALGKYNDTLPTESATSWKPTDRAFVIGDGTGLSDRSACFYILKNGNGWMQGTLVQNSDARLKTNIYTVDNALNKIKSLTGYSYNWKDSTTMPGLYTGVLAQEVQAVMPELVVPNSEGDLAVNYMGMVPYLIESIKTLEARIKQLEAEQKGKRKKRR